MRKSPAPSGCRGKARLWTAAAARREHLSPHPHCAPPSGTVCLVFPTPHARDAWQASWIHKCTHSEYPASLNALTALRSSGHFPSQTAWYPAQTASSHTAHPLLLLRFCPSAARPPSPSCGKWQQTHLQAHRLSCPFAGKHGVYVLYASGNSPCRHTPSRQCRRMHQMSAPVHFFVLWSVPVSLSLTHTNPSHSS